MVKRFIQIILFLLLALLLFFTYLSVYGISTDKFNNLISEHYESIKMLDLRNFLSQDMENKNQKIISTERTPYIFRQVSLDLKTFDYSEDFSDINLSFQCHMFLKFPYKCLQIMYGFLFSRLHP